MRASRLRVAVAVLGSAATMATGTLASAHLPRYVVVSTELGLLTVKTYGATVRHALRDGGVTLGTEDRVQPDLGAPLVPGTTLRVRRAFPVTIIADGHTRVLLTAAPTVDGFLTEHGVSVRPRDRVFPSLAAAVWPGATVRILRIDTRVETVEEPVPFGRVTRKDPALPRGMAKVVQAGRRGTKVHRVAVILADGHVIERRPLGSVLARPPLDRILSIGTRRMFASRGEFAGKEILLMEATAYAPWHGRGVNDITAIGLKAGYGVVAVDPSVIPLRSVLFIDGYGRALAGDTGGAIKGNRIDLGFDTVREAYRFGRRPVRVYILSLPKGRQR